MHNKQDSLEKLYADLHRATVPLEHEHKERLQCKSGCSGCCIDDLTVFEVEAEHIQQHCEGVLLEVPHPEGQCAFLDAAGACRIYAHRPYVCRTQGLPLRWIEDGEDQRFEYRDICELNETPEPLEMLPPDACWTIGPYEGRLAMLQHNMGGENLKRVSLRSLFK